MKTETIPISLKALCQRLEDNILDISFNAQIVSEKAWREKPRPDKWSKKEILGHLVDSALNNLRRFTEVQFFPQPYKVISYNQDELVKANGYQQEERTRLINVWRSLNLQILQVWTNMKQEQLQLEVISELMKEPASLGWLMNDYIDHMDYHKNQIFKKEADKVIDEKQQVSLARAFQSLKKSAPATFVTLFENDAVEVEIYIPKGKDLQKPHSRNELYIVISGHGEFLNGSVRHPFSPGDVLFVPKGVEHRFEKFSADFQTWVVWV